MTRRINRMNTTRWRATIIMEIVQFFLFEVFVNCVVVGNTFPRANQLRFVVWSFGDGSFFFHHRFTYLSLRQENIIITYWKKMYNRSLMFERWMTTMKSALDLCFEFFLDILEQNRFSFYTWNNTETNGNFEIRI